MRNTITLIPGALTLAQLMDIHAGQVQLQLPDASRAAIRACPERFANSRPSSSRVGTTTSARSGFGSIGRRSFPTSSFRTCTKRKFTADRACREAKTSNAGGLVVYEKHAAAFAQHEAELKLIALLATPSATDGLYLEMQPIMSLVTPHESLNFEVLLRLQLLVFPRF